MTTSEPGGSLAAESLVGHILGGRYAVTERIGRGGMATVYRARDEQLGRDVALKVFDRGLAAPEDLQRQRDEMRHLAGSTHPGLVTLHDAVSDGDRSFLVLEYVAGRDLRARLATGALPSSVVAAIGRDIASALAHLHSRGLVHRDVSPGNILLPSGDAHEHGVAAKLTDLGIARVVDSGQITATGTLIGTAAYLSPEQVRGLPVSSASDIYSLGLVLLESLTGARSFPGPAMESAAARLHRDPDTSAVALPRWRMLLAAMTAREPSDRPTAAEVSRALTAPELAADQETTTAPLTAPMPQQTRVLEQPPDVVSAAVTRRRLRALASAAGLLLLVAVAAWALAGTGGRAATPPQPHYPVLQGNLGTDLSRLEHEVGP